MNFKVAIIGRPNVGKSSLFNRLLNKRLSIVYEESGTTKDRIYAITTWLNQKFLLVDTGGIVIDDTFLMQQIKYQTELAIAECHVIILVVDGQTGLVSEDLAIAKMLYNNNKKIIITVNKIDNITLLSNIYEFYSLGFEDVIGISTLHGIGIGVLLDKIVFYHPRLENFSDNKDSSELKFCLVGQPNVGKSTLTNALLSQERMIVSEMPHTTTDAVDTFFEKEGQKYCIIDTAGLSKKYRLDCPQAHYSFLRTMDAIERSDIVCLVLDASQPIVEKDRGIAALIFNYQKTCIIIYNKWDLLNIELNNTQELIKKTQQEFKFFHHVPVVFLSAYNKKKIHTLFSALKKTFDSYRQIFATHFLNDILYEATHINPPSVFKGGKAKFYYLRQQVSRPPEFLCLVNDPRFIHFSYERFLKNQLRLRLSLNGIPLKIVFKKKEKEF